MNELNNLSREEIVRLWDKYLKIPIPKLNKQMLVKYIYWHQQAKKHKIDLKALNNALEKATREYASGKSQKEDIVFTVGTKLIRSYKGEKYEVEVIKDGFVYKSEVYKSLSAIARKITGVQWNGRLFFRGEGERNRKTAD
ncbi:MAG: DUF2924 domain-containing protein [Endomicrobium sp.]|jgi:hypothetical protein|nr:DUF2924 domain-containing protein [Endomicrobium sp.]